MMRGKNIFSRSFKVISAVSDGSDICANGSATQQVSKVLEVDMNEQREKQREAGRKGGRSGKQIDTGMLVTAANRCLQGGIPPRNIVSTLRQIESYGNYSERQLRNILQSEGVLKKRT